MSSCTRSRRPSSPGIGERARGSFPSSRNVVGDAGVMRGGHFGLAAALARPAGRFLNTREPSCSLGVRPVRKLRAG